MATFVDRIDVPAGAVIARQGELAHEFFVIIDGTVEVARDEGLVAELGAGDFFGEIGLIGGPHRTATVIATSHVELAVLARREFRTMIARFPTIASSILSTAARRITSSLRAAEMQATGGRGQ